MLRKKSIVFRIVSLLSLALIAACSAGGDSSLGDDDDDDGSGNSFHFETGGYVVQTGEYYHCFFRDVETGATETEKVGVKRFAYTPDGGVLHHIVIFSASASEGNTDRDCELLEENWNPRYAGGTDTDPLVMPEGVAMPVEPIEHLVIQFHYLNVDAPVADNASVDIEFTEPGEEFIPASLIVSGKTDFEIPANTANHVVSSQCDVPAQVPGPLNVFAVWPHMHQRGTWFKIDGTFGGQGRVLWDAPWQFGDQPLQRLDPPLQVDGGDTVRTACTYDNPDDTPITYGESSNQEMCFDFFFYYPALYNGPLPCPFDL